MSLHCNTRWKIKRFLIQFQSFTGWIQFILWLWNIKAIEPVTKPKVFHSLWFIVDRNRHLMLRGFIFTSIFAFTLGTSIYNGSFCFKIQLPDKVLYLCTQCIKFPLQVINLMKYYYLSLLTIIGRVNSRTTFSTFTRKKKNRQNLSVMSIINYFWDPSSSTLVKIW